MYAVFDDRNQQYRAAPGERVLVTHNPAWQAGSTVTFDKVCLVSGEDAEPRVGTPYVEGASVTAQVLGSVKGRKLVIQKFKRRKNYRRRTGFRARFTELRVEAIDA